MGLAVYSFLNYGILDNPGKVLYKNYCADCHGDRGEGIRQLIPPLKNADMAMANYDSIACWIRNGMTGTIMVNGKEYNQIMYPIKLNEVETANIINYIAEEFLNLDKRISSNDVAKQLRDCKKE